MLRRTDAVSFGEQMKAVVLAVALFGCWHFSGADEPPPVESRGLSDARRDALLLRVAGSGRALPGPSVGNDLETKAGAAARRTIHLEIAPHRLRDARGRADAGVADAEAGDRFADETGAQSTGGSLGGPGGAGGPGIRKGSGRPGPGWRRAPVDAGVMAAPVDAGVISVPPGCVAARVIGTSIQGSEVILIIGAGSDRGVAGSWTVTVPGQPQASVRIVRVDKVISVVKVVRASLNDIGGNRSVVLCP